MKTQNIVSSKKSTFKKSLPVLLGSAMEAYDFVLYGMLAATFSKIFFPQNLEAKVSLSLSFLLFFCAYLTRPLGGILWGYIGDKYGRKKVLTSTVVIMSLSAIGMILVPTYSQIGLASTMIVILLRSIQGIALSGEFSTTMVCLYELSDNKNKGLFCSLTETTVTIGHLIGVIICLILVAVLTQEEFESFGWRIPFIFSIFFIFLVYYIRRNFQETLSFKGQISNIPIALNIRKNLGEVLKIILFVSTNSFLLFSFLFYTNITVQKINVGNNHVTPWIIQLLCVFLLVIFYPLFGFAIDKIGIRRLSNLGHILIFIFYFPIYYFFILHQNLSMNVIGIVLSAMLLSMLATSYIPIIVSMANPLCRISVVSLGWSLSVIIFGASAPFLINVFIQISSTETAPAVYIMLLCLISLFISFKYNNLFVKHMEKNT